MSKLVFIILVASSCFLFNDISAQNIPCKGKYFVSDSDYYRITETGSSMDMTTSQKKAMMKARTNITTEINKKCISAIDSQTQYDNEAKLKIKSLILVAIRQEVSKMKVICQNSNIKQGKQECSVVVEISKNDLVKNIVNTINSDSSLKALFNSSKYRKALN